MPAVKMLQDAYLAWGLDAEELNDVLKQEIDRRRDGNQVTTKHGDHHKEENENKERTKENKDKEENNSLSTREALKSSFVIPTVEEVQQYLDEIGETRFTGEFFCDKNNSLGWMLKPNCPVQDWKALVRVWRKRERKAIKGKDNATHTNQQRQAAGAGAQAAGAAAREEHRKEDLERHLASHHPGDDRLAKLAREIDEVAQEVGVPTAEYSLQQIAYDAQSLLYKFVWCQGWTDERWREVMQQVARRLKKAAQPGQKAKLDSNALFEIVFDLRNSE